MRAFTRRRLLASLKLGLAVVPFAVALRLIHGEPLVPGTVLWGFASGFVVGIAELFWLRGRFGSLSFLPHLALKSALIAGLMYVAFAVLEVLDVVLEGLSWGEYRDVVLAPSNAIPLLEAFGIVALLLFFVHLDRLLGPGVLLGTITGRYHRPRREDRVFLFLDLTGSTSLAEGMDPGAYFEFLHACFSEMSEPILETGAEIYQYVGDEVVLSWPLAEGLEDAACVRVFFLIDDRLRLRAPDFQRRFGAVPSFKAGLHAGSVIAAQIGELKREVVYSGDVLNTTARIEAQCNALGHRLLASAELARRLDPGEGYRIEPMGEVDLRGKREALELVAIER